MDTILINISSQNSFWGENILMKNVTINVLKNIQEDAIKGGVENEGDWLYLGQVHFLR